MPTSEGPWKVNSNGVTMKVVDADGKAVCMITPRVGVWNGDLIAAAPTLLKAGTNAAATLEAIYGWVDRVSAAGGPTSISGVAECHAMLKSLEKNRPRVEALVMVPLRKSLKT